MLLAKVAPRETRSIVTMLARMTMTLAAALGFAVVARSRDESGRQRALELANTRLRLAVDARDAALERERDARAAAEQANELQDRFLSTVSHELRTPLNAVVGWAHVLKVSELTDAQLRAIDGIERNARAQSRLISDLLDVAKLIRGRLDVHLAETDLRSPVAAAVDVARPIALAKGISLAFASREEPILVMGDTERLQQVTANLLSNAVKYTPRGGGISVAIVPDGTVAELRIRDSGEGIAAAELQHLFDPFFQAHTQVMRAGLGLGLAIVKELVELHGGTVAVSSGGRGRGATFAVTLPLAQRLYEGSGCQTSTEPSPTPPLSSLPIGSAPTASASPSSGSTV
jgi:signal transduction histidine kinase